MTEALLVHLRAHRQREGLTQGQLAERVGLSRQAIVAIEAGRQVPSTAVSLLLARVLGCAVEDLFALPGPPPLRAVLCRTGEGPVPSRLALGRVDGTWVAHGVEREDCPGDAVRSGEVSADGTAPVQPLGELDALESNVLVAGCAPLLGLLARRAGREGAEARATWVPANSRDALELLARGAVHVAGLHLAAEPGDHASCVRQRLPGRAHSLVHLTRWRQGLVVAPGNPRGIHGVDDLLRPDVRTVGRESGAGARGLLEGLLQAHGHGRDAVAPVRVATGHAEVARLVRLGLADTGVAIEAAALAEGLDFVPLAEERFDLVVPRERLASEPVARLIELLGRPAFRLDAGCIAGYDLSGAGHVSSAEAS